MTSIAGALRETAAALACTSKTPRLDAELLMAHAVGVSRSDLLLNHQDAASPELFAQLAKRRATSEPVAYIIGHQEFYGREFRVTADTLIPRADSETVIETALMHTRDARRVLDLGTGTGALLLSFVAETDAQGVGIDKSPQALLVARENSCRLGLDRRVKWHIGDWCKPRWSTSLGQFDLIMCNPPYIEQGAHLDADVRQFEPACALFSGNDGLDDYRVLVPQLRALLSSGGAVVLEIGHQQAEDVRRIAADCGFTAELFRDLAHRPRALLLR